MVAQQILVLFVEVRILLGQLLFYSMDEMLIIVLLLLFVKMIIILSENDYDEIDIVIACESSNSFWSIRLTVRTTDFHSVNRGSIPLHTTKNQKQNKQ